MFLLEQTVCIFTKLAPRPIQSLSCNLCQFLFVFPSFKSGFAVDWRLLVEDRITDTG